MTERRRRSFVALLLSVLVLVWGVVPVAGASTAAATPVSDERLPVEVASFGSGVFTPHIIGGTAATQVPKNAVALIVYGGAGGFTCTGVLVAPQWVLTAGHCLVAYNGDVPVRVLNDPANYEIYLGTNVTGTPRYVDRIVLHDDYLVTSSVEDVPGFRTSVGGWVEGTANVTNDKGLLDAGLMHLTTSATATPIPLGVDDLLVQSGRTVSVTGWGLTSAAAETIPSTLQETQMQIANTTYCEIAWRGFYSAATSLCFLGTASATCLGDSGGPVLSLDDKGTWWLAGIVSGGEEGCPVNSPYVGVRAGALADWLVAVTGQAQAGRLGESFNPLSPLRIVDSREGQGVSFVPPTVSDPATLGLYLPKPTLPAGFVTRRPITGEYGVPGLPVGGVAGVVLNVTVTDTAGSGWVAVYPCVDGWKGTSNLNFVAGQTVANLVVTKVDRNGDICLRTTATAAVVVDLLGWLGPNGADRKVLAANPVRLRDTRGTAGTDPVLSAGQTIEVTVTGAGKAPAGSVAVALNVTSTGATADGFVTVYPCGETRPLASNLNPTKGRDVPNAVMVKVPTSGTKAGKVCLYTLKPSHLVVDLNGWVTGSTPATVKALTPGRLLDTRSPGQSKLAADTSLPVNVAGLLGVPSSELDSVLLNVTVAEPENNGHLVVYPCTPTLPTVSNLNFTAGQSVPNAVMAKVDGSGNVCVWATSRTHVIVDVVGFVRSG